MEEEDEDREPTYDGSDSDISDNGLDSFNDESDDKMEDEATLMPVNRKRTTPADVSSLSNLFSAILSIKEEYPSDSSFNPFNISDKERQKQQKAM